MKSGLSLALNANLRTPGGGGGSEAALIAAIGTSAQSSMADFRQTVTSPTWGSEDLSGNGNDFGQATATRRPAISSTTGLEFNDANDHVEYAVTGGIFSLGVRMRMNAGVTTMTIFSDGAAASPIVATQGSFAPLAAPTSVDGNVVSNRGELWTPLSDNDWHTVTCVLFDATGYSNIAVGRNTGSNVGDVIKAVFLEDSTVDDMPTATTQMPLWLEEV